MWNILQEGACLLPAGSLGSPTLILLHLVKMWPTNRCWVENVQRHHTTQRMKPWRKYFSSSSSSSCTISSLIFFLLFFLLLSLLLILLILGGGDSPPPLPPPHHPFSLLLLHYFPRFSFLFKIKMKINFIASNGETLLAIAWAAILKNILKTVKKNIHSASVQTWAQLLIIHYPITGLSNPFLF